MTENRKAQVTREVDDGRTVFRISVLKPCNTYSKSKQPVFDEITACKKADALAG